MTIIITTIISTLQLLFCNYGHVLSQSTSTYTDVIPTVSAVNKIRSRDEGNLVTPSTWTWTVPTVSAAGSYLSGSWSGPASTSGDWIGLYNSGSSYGSGYPSIWWMNVGSVGVTSATFSTVTATEHLAYVVPSTGGPYVLRYFIGSGYVLGSSSAVVVVGLSSPSLVPIKGPSLSEYHFLNYG